MEAKMDKTKTLTPRQAEIVDAALKLIAEQGIQHELEHGHRRDRGGVVPSFSRQDGNHPGDGVAFRRRCG